MIMLASAIDTPMLDGCHYADEERGRRYSDDVDAAIRVAKSVDAAPRLIRYASTLPCFLR